MSLLENANFWTFVASIGVASLGGFFTWLVSRPKSQIDVQKMVTDSWERLLATGNADRDDLRKQVIKLQTLCEDNEATLLWQRRRIDQLENALHAAHIPIPVTNGVVS